MKVSALQYSPVFGNKSKNFKMVSELVGDLKTDVLVLPELFSTGYNFISEKEVLDFAEESRGETLDFLKALAKRINGVIVAGFAEKDGKTHKLYNSAMAADENDLIELYRKTHLYYKEKLWFSPGDSGFKVFEYKNAKIGMMICFDWIFPESARTLALMGADIIAHPANLVLPYCQRAMITRCLENNVFAITANRIGTENRGDERFTFTGASQILNYQGECLANAAEKEKSIISAKIDFNMAKNKDLNQFNNKIQDRRPDFYF